ncbi:MAG TPA: DNA-binding protein [Nitrososphaeraceae archaeon]|jgi:DNA-binding TFAR19-related protein (PDSD5 family)|nr:DNA-binding protein [Nitrososphaeraceae archaeon]
MSSKEQDKKDDPDIAIIKARKMKELWKQAAALEKSKAAQKARIKTDREIVSDLLYDRGEEVLKLAEIQFPSQTRMIIKRIADLTKAGEIQQRISGGELLMLFRSIGINVRVNTTIKIEDHGKLVSFSEKLKKENKEENSGKE